MFSVKNLKNYGFVGGFGGFIGINPVLVPPPSSLFTS